MENVIRVENGKYIAGKASGESVHANMLTKLWENPNPNVAFAAQNIELSSDDYDFTFWVANYAGNVYTTIIIPKGRGGMFFLSGTTGGAYTTTAQRDVARVSDTEYSIGGGMVQNSNAARTTNNVYFVPIAVYGFKKSLDITAIVSNVSTDARQCMLSDGVTSVADVIDKGSITVTGDGVKTYAQLFNELFALIDFSKISHNSILVRDSSGNKSVYQAEFISNSSCRFTKTLVTNTKLTTDMMLLSSVSSFQRAETIASSTTFSNKGDGIPSNGEKISIMY